MAFVCGCAVKNPSSTDAGAAKTYELADKLQPGHRLSIKAFAGQRSPSLIYNGTVTLDANGYVQFAKLGALALGDLNAAQATHAIRGFFRTHYAGSIVHVHVLEIAGLPVIEVVGSVQSPGLVPWFTDVDAFSVLPSAGGHTGVGQAVYVTHEGRSIYHPNIQAAALAGSLHPGDIVTFSSDL